MIGCCQLSIQYPFPIVYAQTYEFADCFWTIIVTFASLSSQP